MSKNWNTDILDTDLSSMEKLVYIALSKFIDKQGCCYPSKAAIAKKASIVERTVGRCITRLQETGWIEYRHQFKPDGSYSSNLYYLPRMALNPVKSDITLSPIPHVTVSPMVCDSESYRVVTESLDNLSSDNLSNITNTSDENKESVDLFDFSANEDVLIEKQDIYNKDSVLGTGNKKKKSTDGKEPSVKKDIISYFKSKYEEKTGASLLINWGKDMKLAANIETVSGNIEKAKKIIDLFFIDKWVNENKAFSINVVSSSNILNRLNLQISSSPAISTPEEEDINGKVRRQMELINDKKYS